MNIPTDNRTLIVYGGAAALAVLTLYVVARSGATGGQAVGKGVANFAGGLAVGVVKGLGDTVGLPDPADPGTHNEGRLALANGDYLEASKKLPAGEFLAGIFSGSWTNPLGSIVQKARGAFGLGPVGPQYIDPNEVAGP